MNKILILTIIIALFAIIVEANNSTNTTNSTINSTNISNNTNSTNIPANQSGVINSTNTINTTNSTSVLANITNSTNSTNTTNSTLPIVVCVDSDKRINIFEAGDTRLYQGQSLLTVAQDGCQVSVLANLGLKCTGPKCYMREGYCRGNDLKLIRKSCEGTCNKNVCERAIPVKSCFKKCNSKKCYESCHSTFSIKEGEPWSIDIDGKYASSLSSIFSDVKLTMIGKQQRRGIYAGYAAEISTGRSQPGTKIIFSKINKKYDGVTRADCMANNVNDNSVTVLESETLCAEFSSKTQRIVVKIKALEVNSQEAKMRFDYI